MVQAQDDTGSRQRRINIETTETTCYGTADSSLATQLQVSAESFQHFISGLDSFFHLETFGTVFGTGRITLRSRRIVLAGCGATLARPWSMEMGQDACGIRMLQ